MTLLLVAALIAAIMATAADINNIINTINQAGLSWYQTITGKQAVAVPGYGGPGFTPPNPQPTVPAGASTTPSGGLMNDRGSLIAIGVALVAVIIAAFAIFGRK